jgi:hypothetical protein
VLRVDTPTEGKSKQRAAESAGSPKTDPDVMRITLIGGAAEMHFFVVRVI